LGYQGILAINTIALSKTVPKKIKGDIGSFHPGRKDRPDANFNNFSQLSIIIAIQNK
jgi:hypothetical protein